MRINILLLFLVGTFFISHQSLAQWSNETFMHDNIERQYRIYIPDNYDANEPAALVLTLHGLGDNISNFSLVGFSSVADTANFIVLVPQAVTDPLLGTAWNSKAGTFGIYPNTDVDDIGFLNALVDATLNEYNVDPDRVFMCGFSMGGFMTNRMACESNSRFAAFASVAGTMGSGLNECNPEKAIPFAHFHGTADVNVGYESNLFGINVDSLVNFWTANNNLTSQPIHTEIDEVANDGFTIDHYLYTGGNADYELYKINGAAHIWLRKPSNDISYTEEIWNFFNRHTGALNVDELPVDETLKVYPNPTSDILNIVLNNVNTREAYQVSLYDMTGRLVIEHQGIGSQFALPLKEMDLKNGLYLLKVGNHKFNFTQKVILE